MRILVHHPQAALVELESTKYRAQATTIYARNIATDDEARAALLEPGRIGGGRYR